MSEEKMNDTVTISSDLLECIQNENEELKCHIQSLMDEVRYMREKGEKYKNLYDEMCGRIEQYERGILKFVRENGR